jgi:FAD/FMN-containing dehydrogenase
MKILLETLSLKLSESIGNADILTDASDMAPYLTDWTAENTGAALAVVRPTNTIEVSTVLKWAYEDGIAVIPQGGNTGIAGGSVPDASGKSIVLSLQRMNEVREVNASAMTMTVEAGCVLADLHKIVEAKDLFFPLSLGAKGSCMIGGNLATNAGGINVLRYGNARELCLGIEVVLADGRIMDLLTGLRKDNTGYDLRDLFIGSEGTLGVITSAVLKLLPLPKARAIAYVSVPDITHALELLNHIQANTGGAVEAFEMVPEGLMTLLAKHVPRCKQPFEVPPKLSILIEIAAASDLQATPGEDGRVPVVGNLELLLEGAFETGHILDAVVAASDSARAEMWELRESAFEAVTKAGPRLGFDIALPLNSIQAFVNEMTEILEKMLPEILISPIGHLGDGNLHFELFAPKGQESEFNDFCEDFRIIVLDAVAHYKGSFSAEHGIGTEKLNYMRLYKDPVALELMSAVKKALDPKNIMNPGRVIPN